MTTEKKSKGSSTYSFSSKVAMAVSTIIGLSDKPLYWIFFIGFSLIFLAVLLSFIGLFVSSEIKNIPSHLILTIIIGLVGIIICSFGVVGIYVSYLFTEIRQRPHSIIRKIYTSEDF
ncbi:MAG: hypothetical protein H7Y04_00025 [Verrucomicrobia bacterium]|nr:hypothetical protein [Cytophagales bacterium]